MVLRIQDSIWIFNLLVSRTLSNLEECWTDYLGSKLDSVDSEDIRSLEEPIA